MEFLRRPTVLAAIAAGVLAINLVWMVASGGDDSVDDPLAGATASPGPGGSGTADDGADGSDGGTPSEGATGDAAPDGAAGDDAQDEPTSEDPEDAASQPLSAPMEGSYTYASSGSWSFDDGTPEEHQLPATSTATVTASGGEWSAKLVAGQLYADTFAFTVGIDGGLDWDVWTLERTIGGNRSTTTYTCTADTAWYRPDADAGRTLTHVCESDGGTVSTGEVEVVGTEEVTLGDGTVVAADHIVYRTTDSSTTEQFKVTGEGQIDLWLDPQTGLRVREQRSSATTTTDANGQEYVYTEDVSFLLQSLTPGA